LSRQVVFGEPCDEQDSGLLDLAAELSIYYLNAEPHSGDIATISVVTDGEVFAQHTKHTKAANDWHQEFIRTEKGFFLLPEHTHLLVVALMAGTMCVRGVATFTNPVVLEEVPSGNEVPTKEEALLLGDTVIGAQDVLMKSKHDPVGAENIYELQPRHAHLMSAGTIHKLPPDHPTGRTFFRLDTRV